MTLSLKVKLNNVEATKCLSVFLTSIKVAVNYICKKKTLKIRILRISEYCDQIELKNQQKMLP